MEWWSFGFRIQGPESAVRSPASENGHAGCWFGGEGGVSLDGTAVGENGTESGWNMVRPGRIAALLRGHSYCSWSSFLHSFLRLRCWKFDVRCSSSSGRVEGLVLGRSRHVSVHRQVASGTLHLTASGQKFLPAPHPVKFHVAPNPVPVRAFRMNRINASAASPREPGPLNLALGLGTTPL